MKFTTNRFHTGGFTLIDALIGSAISSLVLAALVVSSIAMRRTFEGANYHATAQNEQLRVFDYLGRDLRSAVKVTVLDEGTRIDLEMPAVSASTLSAHLNLPILGSLQTTGETATRAVRYYREGDRLVRDEAGKQKEIARTVSEFSMTRTGATAQVTATFSPKFVRSELARKQRPVRLSTVFFLRNALAP